MANLIHPNFPALRERGVVMIITLFLLMIISILASISIKGATSTEQVASQSRQVVLAQQAAEAALRYCEGMVQAFRAGRIPNIQPQAFVAGVDPLWKSMGNWDVVDPATSAGLTVVPLTAFADTAGASPIVYFKRPPECIAQYQTAADTQRVIVTARGFGPEVSSTRTTTAPTGTEVWLQSVITMN